MAKSELIGTELTIYVSVRDALIDARISDETANRYSLFAVQIYREVSGHPVLQAELNVLYSSGKESYPALKQWYRSTTMAASEGVELGYLKAAGRGALRGAGGEIASFFDIAVSIARANKIDMNECALDITKVILDVLAAAALAGTVAAAWAAAFLALAAAKDARSAVSACFGT
jgi:hypothetical protein